jgi:tetratricopeptide (TPR) repeat protein
MKIRALLILFVFSCSQVPLPSLAQSPSAPSAESAFLQGMAFYDQLDYENAIQAFEKALQGDGLGRDERVKAYTCLGVIYVGMNRKDEAIGQFLSLLKIAPDVSLDYGLRSPKVMEALREAREIYIREMKATDTVPPVIQASPVSGKVPFGNRLDLTFRISDSNRIVQPQIFFRKKGDLTYDFLPLQPQGGDVFFASIPSAAVTGEAVEYYVVAIDEAGNATIEGSAGIPFSVPVAQNPEVRPWYKKWWVWTLVAVVAGGGTAAGVLLSTSDDGGKSANTGSASITFGP